MALNVKPKAQQPKPKAADISDEAFERVISKAPDYKGSAAAAIAGDAVRTKEKGVKMGNKRQITLTIDPEQLDEVDALARRRHMSRASVMILAIAEHLYRNREG